MTASRRSSPDLAPLPPDSDGDLPGFRLADQDFQWFRKAIYRCAGICLGPGKATMVAGRLRKRLLALRFSSFFQYREHLERLDAREPEWGEFVNALTTNKTAFFRERHHFDFLRERVVPELRVRADRGARDRTVRVWSAACSTGEEPYTVAMVLRDTLAHGWRYQVLATDIDTAVLRAAASGRFPEERVVELPEALRRRHFSPPRGEEKEFVAHPDLTAAIRFRQLNFIEAEWSLGERFDVIFCRNVLIYFDRDTQSHLLGRLVDHLAPEGYLMIGHSESLIGMSDRFERVDDTVYRLRRASNPGRQEAARPTAGEADPAKPDGWESVTRTDLPVVSATAAAGPTAPARPSPTAAPVSRLVSTSQGVKASGSDAGHGGALPLPTRRIDMGQGHASAKPVCMNAVIGPCVAVCLHDPQGRVGGMGRFFLAEVDESGTASARFGAQALEQLIREILRLGGDRRRLWAKLFGGAHAAGSPQMARKNQAFVPEYLARAGIPVRAERLGGVLAMEVRFEPHTGRAQMRYLPPQTVPLAALEAEAVAKVRRLAATFRPGLPRRP